MEKKISFGFSKISKKPNLLQIKTEQKDEKNEIELIKCLEGQAIQLVEKKEEEVPLVIPLKEGGKTSAALLSLRTRQAVLNGEEILVNEEKPQPIQPPELNGNGTEDIDKRAARELLEEIRQENDENISGPALVLPIKAENLPLDGAKESTIDDYESIPITQFGKAMLRGMGWKDKPKKKGGPIEEGPVLRPKGMGLGADKALKSKALLVPPEANEILEIKKGACVLVLGGKNKDLYGQVEGLDEHAGRVIVKMALGGVKESFNEFMVQPVSKKEYSQYSKCINTIKYDQYKAMENEYGQIILNKEKIIKEEDTRSKASKNDEYMHKHNGHSKNDDESLSRYSTEPECSSQKVERRSRSRDRRDKEYGKCSSSRNKDLSRRMSVKRRSKSVESLYSSESSSHRNKHKKKSSKSKKSKKRKDKKVDKRHSSVSSSDDEKRHTKKTKKSKRRRSRSRSKARK